MRGREGFRQEECGHASPALTGVKLGMSGTDRAKFIDGVGKVTVPI